MMLRPQVIRRTIAVPGAMLTVWDWPAKLEGKKKLRTGPPAVVIVHATGYHSRCYDHMISCLNPAMRCVCIDLRGHGGSSKPKPTSLGWTDEWSKEEWHYFPYPQFGADVAEVTKCVS